MSAAVWGIITVVVIGAIGIAYFSNAFCQPSGNTLCWPPSPTSLLPGPPSTEGTPEEDIELAKPLVPQITDVLGQTIGIGGLGGAAPKTGLLPPIGAPLKSRMEVSQQKPPSLARRMNVQLMTKNCKARNGPSSCFSEGLAKCVPCGSTAKDGCG